MRAFIWIGIGLFPLSTYSAENLKCTIDASTSGELLQLEMGDWSCDGHCKTSTALICSTLSLKDFEAAVTKGEEKAQLEFREDVASEYEDTSLSKEQIKKLQKAGVKIPPSAFEDGEDGNGSVDEDSYSEIVLELARVGNEKFRFSRVIAPRSRAGGYGLFD